MDYFGTRYYASTQGRFTSPDEPFADQSEGDPQSWNLYSYVRNNPLRFTDPFGLARYDKNGNWIGDYDDEFDKDLKAYWRVDKNSALGGNWDFGGNKSPIQVSGSYGVGDFFRALLPRSFSLSEGQIREVDAYQYRRMGMNDLATCRESGGCEPLTGDVASGGLKLLGTARMNLLNAAKNPKLRNIIQNLYRVNAKVGRGSTADQVRFERNTALLQGFPKHGIKANNEIRALRDVLRNRALDPSDRAVAEALKKDLERSMKGLR